MNVCVYLKGIQVQRYLIIIFINRIIKGAPVKCKEWFNFMGTNNKNT